MKRKIFLLITGCIITVAALTCIQGYFIYNSYKLEAKEAHAAITSKFLEFETSGKLDAINKVWMLKTQKFVDRYQHRRISKNDYAKMIIRMQDSLSSSVSNYLKKDDFLDGYNVSYSNYLMSVVISEDHPFKTDTLYKGKMLLYGNNNINHNPETMASQSVWNDDSYGRYNFEATTMRFYSISNWEEAIMIKLCGLLAFSILLLVFVVLLFYWSIKNLITQKKIVDIKTDFINNITHEFQTPLAALDIAVMTLKKKDSELTPDQYATTLSIIERQNHRMQKLFRQVTDVSLTEDMIVTDSKQTVTWREMCHIPDDFSLTHPSVTIHCSAEDEEITLPIDRFHLSTVLLNLLDNAVKYGADTITVTIERSGKNILLSVKDNGIGIPEKEHHAIFDKFYRVEKGNIHTTKGLGLGLFYVKQIIEAYKGHISVNSKGPGTTFIISIPAL